MLAIKGIEMPTCCYSCRFARFSDDFHKVPYCTIEFKRINLSRFDRPDWCPLIEVKDTDYPLKPEVSE
jgi:hypothetical protein